MKKTGDNNKEVKTVKIGLRGYKKTLKKVKKLKKEMKQLNKAAKEFAELKDGFFIESLFLSTEAKTTYLASSTASSLLVLSIIDPPFIILRHWQCPVI